MAPPELVNNLHVCIAEKRLCKAFGVKLLPTSEIVAIAKSSDYDALFIDLEHSVLSLRDASQLCAAGLALGITPFVRVPKDCGGGFVQRVLDGGAMGVVFPGISSVEEATTAISLCKYAPHGHRGMSSPTSHFHFQPPSNSTHILNKTGSSVLLIIETALAIQNIDAIAACPGYDALVIGCNDLAAELGIHGQWDHPLFMETVRKVGEAARRNEKVLGVGGMPSGRMDLMRVLVKEVGVGWWSGGHDLGCLIEGAREGVREVVEALEG